MRKLIITSLLTIGLTIPLFSSAQNLEIKNNAPTRYTVQKGDTLWKISNRYLHRPWDWAKLWGWNKDQIRNPNRIYPGQVLILNYIDGQPRLGIEGGFRQPALYPHMRPEENGQAINGIDYTTLKAFFKRPMIVTEEEFNKSARIVSGPRDHILITKGDRVYARGVVEPGTYAIYEPNKKIFDPDTGAFIGFEVAYNGDAVVEKLTGDVQTMTIAGTDQEIQVGNRLLKTTAIEIPQIVPHAYEGIRKGKVVSFYQGVREGAQFSTIAINLGKNHDIEHGHVFGLYRAGQIQRINDVDNVQKIVQLPVEEVGVAMVYRTFDNISYAVVMRSSVQISVGELVAPPGLDMEYFNQQTIEGSKQQKKKEKENK
jgi:nucleoid-associated protein YgaU